MNTKTLADENGKRKVSDRSLENLKLGAEARNKNKERTNLTLLPETVRWLKGWGNASEKVDELVAEARRNFFQPTLPIQDQGAEVERLKARAVKLEEELRKANRLLDQETERADEAVRDGLKAASLLHQALTLKANAGGAIKSKIKEALKLIDDI